jgi:hypothetical protein
MPKMIDLELLELALWQAYLTYIEKGSSKDRPLKAPCKDDVSVCSDALKAVRNSWGLVMAQKEVSNFQEMKARALDGMREEKQWTLEGRNLYSSAVSVYMSWDRGRTTIKPELRQKLQAIRNVGYALQERKLHV